MKDACSGRSKLKVLDIGCGTGLGFRLLKSTAADFDYTGVDVSPGMLQQFEDALRKSGDGSRARLLVCSADGVMERVDGRLFDVIILTNTAASFVGSPTALLADCAALLEKRGVVVASFLNRRSLRRRLAGMRGGLERFRTRGSKLDGEGARAVTVTEEELRRRCAEVGLRVRWVRYQSVFGGVMEHRYAIPIEKAVKRLVPHLGHSINLLAESMKAV